MDIKHAHADTGSDDYSAGKPKSLHLENLAEGKDGHHLSKAEKVHAVDEIITRPDVTLESFAHLDIKKILWKIDRRLIPMLTLLYLLSFLDRGNIGNAKIEGLSEDLGLTGAQYNWCLTAFFFPYCFFGKFPDTTGERKDERLTGRQRCHRICCSRS